MAQAYLEGVTVDVNKLAETLAKIAGPIARQGWDVYVRQQYVDGIEDAVWAVVMAVAMVAGILLFRWGWKTGNRKQEEADQKYEEDRKTAGGYRREGYYKTWDGESPTREAVAIIVGGIFAFAFGLVTLMLATAALGHFINPEYGAIQEILGR